MKGEEGGRERKRERGKEGREGGRQRKSERGKEGRKERKKEITDHCIVCVCVCVKSNLALYSFLYLLLRTITK
jgi:hypothetical protein